MIIDLKHKIQYKKVIANKIWQQATNKKTSLIV